MSSILDQLQIEPTLDALVPLTIYTAGMVLFGFFIWYFYRFLAKRDILGFDIHKYNTFEAGSAKKFFTSLLHTIEFVFLIPIFTFFWFSVLSIILIVLSPEPNISNILLIAMSIVATTRIVSYFNEDLSRDIAKMLPFGILATFVIDPTTFPVDEIIANVLIVKEYVNEIVHYALFTIFLEFFLRAYYSLRKLVKGEEKFLVEEHLKKAKESGNFEWND